MLERVLNPVHYDARIVPTLKGIPLPAARGKKQFFIWRWLLKNSGRDPSAGN
jgi:hypothetical protein